MSFLQGHITSIVGDLFHILKYVFKCSLISLQSQHSSVENTECFLQCSSRSFLVVIYFFMGKEEVRLILARMWLQKNGRSVSEQLKVQTHRLGNLNSVV